MEIHEHAIDRYIERVLGVNLELAGPSLRTMAEQKVRQAAEHPDETYHGDKTKPPVHIKGPVAVPVDGETVPTTYKAITFRKKMNV